MQRRVDATIVQCSAVQCSAVHDAACCQLNARLTIRLGVTRQGHNASVHCTLFETCCACL